MLSLNNESHIKEAGYPELPKIVRSIAIPPTSDVKCAIIDSEYKDISLSVIPSKGYLLMKTNPEDVPYAFADVYSKSGFFPEQQIKISDPYLIRTVRGSDVTIHPFMYNPVTHTLRIFTKLVVEILFEGENNKNALSQISNKRNVHFEPIFKNHFINYDLCNYSEKSSSTNRTTPVFLK